MPVTLLVFLAQVPWYRIVLLARSQDFYTATDAIFCVQIFISIRIVIPGLVRTVILPVNLALGLNKITVLVVQVNFLSSLIKTTL